MEFFVKVYVSAWIDDMRSMTTEEIDVDSILEMLEEKIQDYIAYSNGLDPEQVYVTALLSRGRDVVDSVGGEAFRAALIKDSIVLDLKNFRWRAAEEIMKLM